MLPLRWQLKLRLRELAALKSSGFENNRREKKRAFFGLCFKWKRLSNILYNGLFTFSFFKFVVCIVEKLHDKNEPT